MNNFYKETKKYKKNRLEFKNKRVYSKLVNDKSKIIIILNSIIHDIIPIDGLYKDRHPITLEKLDIE